MLIAWSGSYRDQLRKKLQERGSSSATLKLDSSNIEATMTGLHRLVHLPKPQSQAMSTGTQWQTFNGQEEHVVVAELSANHRLKMA